jgi:hypothetical protein
MAEGDIACFRFSNNYYIDEPRLDGAYRIKGEVAVAWRVLGYKAEANEDTEWSGYLVNTGELFAYMVGDDRAFPVDECDLTLLADGEFCGGCGQIGCGWC